MLTVSKLCQNPVSPCQQGVNNRNNIPPQPPPCQAAQKNIAGVLPLWGLSGAMRKHDTNGGLLSRVSCRLLDYKTKKTEGLDMSHVRQCLGSRIGSGFNWVSGNESRQNKMVPKKGKKLSSFKF
jgi:hypothetical protein